MVCPRIKNAILAKNCPIRGHFLFPTAEKGSKNSAGGYPQTPGDPVGSLFRRTSPAVIIKTDDTIRGCGPGDLGRCIVSVRAQSTPGAPGPSLYGRGQVAAFESIFIKRKSTKSPGVQGAKPLAFSSPFLCGKKGVPRGMSAYRKRLHGLSAHKERNSDKNCPMCGHFLLSSATKESNADGGYPCRPPDDPVGSLLRRTSPAIS